MAKWIMACLFICGYSFAASADPTSWNKKTTIPTTAGTSCITTTPGGDTIIVGTYDKGIFVSRDGGAHWLRTLSFVTDSAVYCIRHVGGHKVVAGTNGRVYVSDNDGMTWRKASIVISYPVRDIIAVSTRLYVCTGDYASGVSYGDGVLISADGGNSWIRRNTGLAEHESVWHLASDRIGRIFATALDETGIGDGGLYYTENEGVMWTRIPMSFNGMGIVYDDINITETFELAISPDDSIVCSANAISGSALVAGIFKNTFGGAAAATKWSISGLRPSSSFWLRTPTHSLYFVSSDKMLGSYSGSVATGGPHYSADHGYTWQRVVDGLDLVGGGYNSNAYAYGRNKRVYMIQHGDNDLYYMDDFISPPAIVTGTVAQANVSVFPNPSQNVLYVTGNDINNVTIIGIDGSSRPCSVSKSNTGIIVQHHLPPGCYFLQYATNGQPTGIVRFNVGSRGN